MNHRAVIFALATLLAVTITAQVTFPAHPFAGLLVTAGIVAAYSATLPGPGWRMGTRLAGKTLRAVRAWRHARWVSRMSLVAQAQKDARHSHPDNCFCTCGIDRAALAWFRDGLELAAREMQQREDERRRHQ